MSYSIFITPTALNDMTVAIEYYNSLSEELGYRFAGLVSDYFSQIAAMPSSSPNTQSCCSRQ